MIYIALETYEVSTWKVRLLNQYYRLHIRETVFVEYFLLMVEELKDSTLLESSKR